MATAHPRESACPVHFVWEGRGAGRTLVRLGFLGFTAWGALWAGVNVLNLRSWQSGVLYGVLPVVTVYALGQALSLHARLRPR